VFVETFEIFTYICAGRQLSNNLFPALAIASAVMHDFMPEKAENPLKSRQIKII
jgi:hypothetical protein